ncbi:MAG: hypothetical protein U0V72_10265 [Cytophagales bacterium]
MNKIKINIYFLLLFFTRLMAGHEEVLYWEKIVAEGVCKLDSLVEANASIGNENSAEASTTIPNYFVDLRSSKAIGISESFIKTLNEYIYNQQLIKGYKDKNYAVYVLLTDKLASVNKEDLLLYFQGLNKINQLSDVNTASVLSLKNAYENAYGKRNLGKELSVNSTVTFPSETTQNQAGKTAVVSNVFKIQESAHDLAIKRIFKLSKISSSDKLGILMGLDLDYSTLGYLINTNTTSSLKININASVAVDKRMASELATDLSSKINNKSTETTLEGKISSKTHLFLEQCKNFNTTTGVLTAELEVYLTDFETKAQNNKLESTEVYNKLTKEHLAQITEKQITRLLAITCKFKSWDSYASKVVYFILNNIPSTKAYKLYKELDTIPSGLKQKVLVYWYNQIKPAALDLESNMKGLSSSLKTLLSKIPVSVLQEEITNALSDATRSLNIDYDYPFTRCNTTTTQLKPLFKNASIDNATNTLRYEYYGIEVYPTYRKCCHEVIYKSGTPTPQCLYYDYRLRGMATTQTCSPISLFYLADYSGGAVKYYYMPAIFLANLSTDAFQTIKENIAWLGVELAVTLVTWPVGGEPGLALYLARVSATTGLIGTSANIASNLGANTLPAGIKKSLDAIGTASGMVSFVTGAGSFVKYYQSASKTISNAKLGNIQTASESLQDELYTAIQHSDELGISPTEIEKYQVALRELDNNYAKVFGKAYVPKLVGKVVKGAGKVLTHIVEADIIALQKVTTTIRSGGVRAINNVKNLVNEGKALVVKPIANSPLAQKMDDYIAAFNNNNSALQGQLGEDIAELMGKEINATGDVLNIKINNSGNGFDVLSFSPNKTNPTSVRIFEAKPLNGTSVELPNTVSGGTQMSNPWTQNNIALMVQHSDQSINQIGVVMNNLYNQGKIERFVVTIDKDLKQVIILKLDNF